ncbi:MAG: hypothetical protein A2068_06495 [Ignavibacteria bacterium GWB2_35_6b]|nr:MAG: hypothetical protein A2068_06495 [Ignavibacteria bacterium GWB2_35_6b]
MSYPKKELRNEALLCLIYFSNNHFLKASQTYEPLSDFFKLTEKEKTELLRKRDEAHWNNLIQNSRKDLKSEGYIGGQEYNIWDLTEAGITKAEKIMNKYLELIEIAQKYSIQINQNTVNKLLSNSVEKKEFTFRNEAIDIDEPILPIRSMLEINRIIRDTQKTKELKKIYDFKCQICGLSIQLPNGCFCEVHHLQPLGGQHKGYDVIENMIVVCPNHHTLFDYSAIAIDPITLNIVQYDKKILGKLFIKPEHKLGREYLEYHFKQIFNLK